MESHNVASSFGSEPAGNDYSGSNYASGDYAARGTERRLGRRLANVYTAAAFQNRLIGGSFDSAPDELGHDAWADAWDRVAALVGAARDRASLARVSEHLRREAAEGRTAEWRAVCAHAAKELAELPRSLR